jgi:hypothetical protein
MSNDAFGQRRLHDPQGVIDDLIQQTTRQGRAIYDLNQEIVKLNKEIVKLTAVIEKSEV